MKTDLARLCAERMGCYEGDFPPPRDSFPCVVLAPGSSVGYVRFTDIGAWKHWDPEHNIQDAWVLVEWLIKEGYEISIEWILPERKWKVYFYAPPGRLNSAGQCADGEVLEDIPLLAITKAFLEATE